MSIRTSRGTRLAVLVLATLGIMTVAPNYALAHDELVSSSPANGAMIAALPAAVVLTFEEPPAAGYTKVRVVNATGHAVGTAVPTTAGSRVTLALPAHQPAGRYAIVWSVLSDDGHPVNGVVRFTVRTAPTPSPAATSKVTAGGHAGVGSLGWPIVVLVAMAVLGGVFGAVRRTS